jgi:hypothetical protein
MLEPVMILGAEIEGLDVHTNYERTALLRTALLKEGLAFDGIINVTKEGRREQKFLVLTDDLEKMLKLARQFKQKTITISDSDRFTSLVSTESGEFTVLGKLQLVTKEEAKQANSFTLVRDDNTEYHFVTNKIL